MSSAVRRVIPASISPTRIPEPWTSKRSVTHNTPWTFVSSLVSDARRVANVKNFTPNFHLIAEFLARGHFYSLLECQSMKRIFNFSAGPAILPVSVLEEASKGILEIGGSGMSILEVSHRGKDYEAIHFDARDRLLKTLNLDPNQFTALFLGGGASLQFAMLPMNYLKAGDSADYIHTGEWSKKAMGDAKKFGKVNVVGSSEEKKFAELPTAFKFTPGAKYVHLTTNNTIEGTEFQKLPEVGATPLIADASSDFMGMARDYSKFSLLYAGAQKNAGPAGVTIVVIRKSYLEQASEDTPAILSYKQHAKADSLYNTPPAFGVYIVGLVLKWIEKQGGLEAVEKTNRRKAGVIYSALDEFPAIYDPAVTRKDDRSIMNLTWRVRGDEAKEKAFLTGAQELGMDGLKGHRSVGGFRASIYNAFPEEGCNRLAEYIREFARR